MKRKNQLSIVSIVAMGIGAALFFVLGRFAAIPTFIPNTTINIQYAILALFAVIYGPIVSCYAGFIGHTLIDLSWGSPWWSWIIATAVFGLIVGLCRKWIYVQGASFETIEIVKFNIVQVIAHTIAWGVVAPTLDILIYNEPVNKLYAQGIAAGVSNALTTGIIGTILLVAYSKTKTKKGSLQKEA